MVKILWLTWKDHLHPDAGGAEIVLRELSYRLRDDGHEVTWLTCGYAGAAAKEHVNGINVIRVGSNRYLHSMQALSYYVRKMRNKYDVVIEVVNTAPYFSVFFGKKSKRYLFYHQLAREIWFYETKIPISAFGYYIIEPFTTTLLSRVGVPVITVSESTRSDLARYGFSPERTHIISEGIEIEPLSELGNVKKYLNLTVLSLGSMRAMKRTLDQIEAFDIAKQQLPDLRLKIAGDSSGSYGQKVLKRIAVSPFTNDIEYVGRVSMARKVKLMQKCHLILQTSLKEGWGLTVSEAASQGTPAVAYDVDGLRDSIRGQETGIVTEAIPNSLAVGIVMLLTNDKMYNRMRNAAWRLSTRLTFNQSYLDLKELLGVL